MSRYINLTGQIFGELTVVSRAENSSAEKARWSCVCACGRIVVVLGESLQRGRTKSCGCLRGKSIAKALTKDLTGQKFGRLTVVKRATDSNRGASRWECECACGNSTVVFSSSLPSGNTRSCGCLRHELLTGPNNPTWKGGITTEEEKVRKSPEYKLWRTAVFQRDNYNCRHCGYSAGGILNAHHIKPFATHPELRLDVGNGITLCEVCHTEVHRSRKAA